MFHLCIPLFFFSKLQKEWMINTENLEYKRGDFLKPITQSGDLDESILEAVCSMEAGLVRQKQEARERILV